MAAVNRLPDGGGRGGRHRMCKSAEVPIRTIAASELRRFLDTVEAAFGHTSSDDDAVRFARILDPGRCLVVDDDGALVGTTAAYTMRLSVPGGGDVGCAGVTMVGVLPTHRRRGLLRDMMTAQLADVAERGEPVAALWASEAAIYRRFGYGLASIQGNISIERDRAIFADDAAPSGRARLVDADAAIEPMSAVYDAVRSHTPGMSARSPAWWQSHRLHDDPEDRDGGGPMKRVVIDDGGRAVAYALYRTRAAWPEGLPAGVLMVIEAIGIDHVATRALWTYLFGIDLVERISAWHLPLDHMLLWTLTEPDRLRFTLEDALWLRIVDVPAALRARAYGLDDSLTIEVADPLLPANARTWRLDAGPTGAEVAAATGDADLVLDVRDLGAIYLGGTKPSTLVAAGRIVEASKGAAARADVMFSAPRAPWNTETF